MQSGQLLTTTRPISFYIIDDLCIVSPARIGSGGYDVAYNRIWMFINDYRSKKDIACVRLLSSGRIFKMFKNEFDQCFKPLK